MKIGFLISTIVLILFLNLLATARVLRIKEWNFRRTMFLIGIWIVPIIGALLVLMVMGRSGASPSQRSDQSHIPGL